MVSHNHQYNNGEKEKKEALTIAVDVTGAVRTRKSFGRGREKKRKHPSKEARGRKGAEV